MANSNYHPIASNEDEKHPRTRENVHKHRILSVLRVVGLAVLSFSAGFGLGENWSYFTLRESKGVVPNANGRLPPQSFFPDSEAVQKLSLNACLTSPVPMKEVQFQFPSGYEATNSPGDQLWNELMPREFSPPRPTNSLAFS